MKEQDRQDQSASRHPVWAPQYGTAFPSLEMQEARTKVLFLISDGRPRTEATAESSVEKEYAVHDTKRRSKEARAKQIVVVA